MGHLLHLPAELLVLIGNYLPNSALKALAQTCRKACNSVRPRLERVFLSANPLDISVFRAVAESETFRYGVKEIIWDDARFSSEDDLRSNGQTHDKRLPAKFMHHWGQNVRNAPSLSTPQLPIESCWEYYQTLYHQQEDVITLEKDYEALLYGIPRFPALERVTVTVTAHGTPFAPSYGTPMIRAFPAGFIYPIPDATRTSPEEDSYKTRRLRGVDIVTRALAQYPDHGVSELVIDANSSRTGVDCLVFQTGNPEYKNLVALLRRSNFTRLDLALLVGGIYNNTWGKYNKQVLYEALAEAKGLQRFTLNTNLHHHEFPRSSPFGDVYLRAMLPVDAWSNLQHFGLSGCHVRGDDLASLLAALPGTLRSLRLSELSFIPLHYRSEVAGDWAPLLIYIRDNLNWRRRHPSVRPTLEIGIGEASGPGSPTVWIDREATEYVYGFGPSPFEEESFDHNFRPGERVRSGVGVIRDDKSDPDFERPNVDPPRLDDSDSPRTLPVY
ncbi:hypothetical protein BJX99DRAFT_233136 [Aspergillus californicus]